MYMYVGLTNDGSRSCIGRASFISVSCSSMAGSRHSSRHIGSRRRSAIVTRGINSRGFNFRGFNFRGFNRLVMGIIHLQKHGRDL